MTASVDTRALETQVKRMYELVATEPCYDAPAITAAGLVVHCVRNNDYAVISDRARNASASYGVHSVSVLATKPRRR